MDFGSSGLYGSVISESVLRVIHCSSRKAFRGNCLQIFESENLADFEKKLQLRCNLKIEKLQRNKAVPTQDRAPKSFSQNDIDLLLPKNKKPLFDRRFHSASQPVAGANDSDFSPPMKSQSNSKITTSIRESSWNHRTAPSSFLGSGDFSEEESNNEEKDEETITDEIRKPIAFFGVSNFGLGSSKSVNDPDFSSEEEDESNSGLSPDKLTFSVAEEMRTRERLVPAVFPINQNGESVEEEARLEDNESLFGANSAALKIKIAPKISVQTVPTAEFSENLSRRISGTSSTNIDSDFSPLPFKLAGVSGYRNHCRGIGITSSDFIFEQKLPGDAT